MGSNVDHPAHYGGANHVYEAIKVIAALESNTRTTHPDEQPTSIQSQKNHEQPISQRSTS